MLAIIKRLLVMSGDLRGRVQLSILTSFLDAMAAMLPLGAVFLVLERFAAGGLADAALWRTVLLLLVGATLLRILLKYVTYRLQSTAGFEFVARERVSLGDRLRRVPMGFFYDHSLGDLTATMTNDLNYLENYGMHLLDRVVTGLVSMAAITLCILIFDWRLGLLFILAVLLSFPLYNYMQKRGVEIAAERQQVQAEAVAATLEFVQGISVVKSFNMAEKNLAEISAAYTRNARAAIHLERTFTPLTAAYGLIFRVTACVIMAASALFAVQGTLTFPYLAVILLASFTIFGPIEVIGEITSMLRLLDAVLDRVTRIKEAPVIDENGRNIALQRFDIVFDHVCFAYADGAHILEDVSFTVPARSMTAIVGPSGSGKTTITRLIARFWDVDQGSVRVGDHDVREFSCDSLLANISMVFQNVYLFHDSIAANIRFGVPNASMEEVICAAKEARCHDFIMQLPQGYDTIIGEGGATLSGGERQRISIARALLKDAPIVLLDEATASVDPENEAELQQAISALTRGKTLVVIAHRLATIRNAEQILVVDGGHIVQRGTHEELLAEEGIYRRFWNVSNRAGAWKIAL